MLSNLLGDSRNHALSQSFITESIVLISRPWILGHGCVTRNGSVKQGQTTLRQDLLKSVYGHIGSSGERAIDA